MLDLSDAVSPRLLSFVTLLAAIAVNIAGETTLKSGMNAIGELHFNLPMFVRTFTSPRMILGFALTFVAAVLWLRVISREPLSWAYPMLGLGALPMLYTSREVLGESVGLQRWVGAVVIIAGVTLVFRS